MLFRSVYRSLIGFGQNADKFSVISAQQAQALDPNNPQQYIELGGIYFQTGQYDDAIREFSIAANLKPDYANAYYNLGYALEAKGDLQNALIMYQKVADLVKSDPVNSKKVIDQIKVVQGKIGQQNKQHAAQQQKTDSAASAENQQPLDVNKPTTQLPERNPKVNIVGPTVSPIPSPSKSATPTK